MTTKIFAKMALYRNLATLTFMQHTDVSASHWRMSSTTTQTTLTRDRYMATKASQTWPDPILSCDANRAEMPWPNNSVLEGLFPTRRLSSLRLWHGSGPAKAAWIEIEPAVGRCLSDTTISEGTKHLDQIRAVRCYMVGTTKQSAHPCIGIWCAGLTAIKPAKVAVEKSQAWQQFNDKHMRAFEVRAFYADSKIVHLGGDSAFKVDDPLAVLTTKHVDGLYGAPLYFPHIDHYRKSTLGGLLYLDDEIYGLTTAHCKIPAPGSQQSNAQQDTSGHHSREPVIPDAAMTEFNEIELRGLYESMFPDVETDSYDDEVSWNPEYDRSTYARPSSTSSSSEYPHVGRATVGDSLVIPFSSDTAEDTGLADLEMRGKVEDAESAAALEILRGIAISLIKGAEDGRKQFGTSPYGRQELRGDTGQKVSDSSESDEDDSSAFLGPITGWPDPKIYSATQVAKAQGYRSKLNRNPEQINSLSSGEGALADRHRHGSRHRKETVRRKSREKEARRLDMAWR